ncbi:hypothetical protein DTO217A2_406 [Paecilomyces variotii]|nr:hypothetical protein DTO217A2_406 [Paecilomyces variotii]
MAEPSEEAITDFVSFTGTSREQAISYLKANDLNSQKAINAYFENPAGPQPEATQFYGGQDIPSFNIENPEPAPSSNYVAPPSRPPSRVNMQPTPDAPRYGEKTDLSAANTTGAENNTEGLTLAEREERDLQQAMAMSLDQSFGEQEIGVTSSAGPNFGPATRDHYDSGEWAMTLFNPSSREAIISPDPHDRARVSDEAAFLRPSQEGLHLGGLLTILHSIPLAREALLLREKVLPDYGYDPQWWNGQPINTPKIVSLDDVYSDDDDWDDILYETQRSIAFLDSTERAFGSVDALASFRSMSTYGPDAAVPKFLETWSAAAERASPENKLTTVFSSHAVKQSLSGTDTPIERSFVTLECFEEPEQGQTLYDVLDRTVWADRPGEELDYVWLERVADVLTIRLENPKPSATSLQVKIPATFYPDRYLRACRDIAREFRTSRLEAYKEIAKLENVMDRFTVSRSLVNKGFTSKEILEKAAAAAVLALPKNLANGATGDSLTPEAANAEGQRLANELRAISEKIEQKLKELEVRRQNALETLRGYSKTLTEPSASPDEPPHCEYTLRGVCTEPHITYVLRRCAERRSEDQMDIDKPQQGWQWWRISFSTDDAKTQQSESSKSNGTGKYVAPPNTDVIGYTARKVREIEVLRAAREESKSVLLVYANSSAVQFGESPAPTPLQEFVERDNESFEFELKEAERELQDEGPEDGQQSPSQEQTGEQTKDGQSLSLTQPVPVDSAPANSENSADYEAPMSDQGTVQGQEMQEKGGVSLFTQSLSSSGQ